MYTRTYSDTDSGIMIPERYGGTSFGGNSAQGRLSESMDSPPPSVDEVWEDVHTAKISSEEDVEASAVAKKLPFLGMFSGIFKGDADGLKKIGTEEILIIAAAAFLFFSKNSDKELAIMLLLLLFFK